MEIFGKPNCKTCGEVKTPDNTSHTYYRGRHSYHSDCRECDNRKAKERYRKAGKVKKQSMNDEEFDAYVNSLEEKRSKAISRRFEPKSHNQHTSQFTDERARDNIKIRPLWTDEEREMAKINRLKDDKNGSIYINYLYAKSKKEI